jgi:hypothetical protein
VSELQRPGVRRSRPLFVLVLLGAVAVLLAGVYAWVHRLPDVPEEWSDKDKRDNYVLNWQDQRNNFFFQMTVGHDRMNLLTVEGERRKVTRDRAKWFAWAARMEPLVQRASQEPQAEGGGGISLLYQHGRQFVSLRMPALGPAQRELVRYVYSSEFGEIRPELRLGL